MEVFVKDIKPHPLNSEIYSVSDIEELSRSIDKIGLLEKIVVTSDLIIISGHRRFEAVKNIGLEKIEVEVRDIDEKDHGLFIISYNIQRTKKPSEILNEIKYLYDYYGTNQGKRTDLTSNNVGRGITTQSRISKDLNISNGNISKLLFIDKTNREMVDLIDKGIMTINQAYLECKRFEKTIKIEQGQKSVRLKNTRIDNDDQIRIFNKSSEKMDELSDGEVQTIYTSPPYWNKRKYSGKGEELGLEKTPDEYIENLVNHFNDCKRVLNKKGSFFLNMGDTYLNNSLQNIPHRVAIGLTERGWILRNTIIWKKTNPKPSSSHTNLTPSYEFIFHMVQNREYLYHDLRIPNSSKTKPSLPPRHRNLKNRSTTSVSPYYPLFNGKNIGDYWDEDIVKTSVYNQNFSNFNLDLEHPAPFPLEIVTLPILQTSNEGDVILDPFMGSGNTGIVSIRMNRGFVGYDTNKSFCELSAKRINDKK